MATGQRRGDHVGATGFLVRTVARLVAGAVALLLTSAVGAVPAHASSEKSFSFDSLVTDVVVGPDASMLVTEVWTYRFEGGPFNFGIRSFDSDAERIRDFAASDADGPLAVIDPSESVSGNWEWKLRQPTSDAVVAYTLTYRVDDAVVVGSDVGDLYWTFIRGEHPPVDSMTVTIRFDPSMPPIPAARIGTDPGADTTTSDTDTGVLRGFAHGPANGRVDVAESTITATIANLPADAFVDVRAVAPAAVFAAAATRDDELLPGILRDERERLGELADAAGKRKLAWIVTPVLALIGLVGTGLLWLTGGRERRSTEVLGKYWREPLDDPPAIALATINRGSVAAGPTIAGTLVDLAQRGYLSIRGERRERIGRDDTVHHYHWAGKSLDGDARGAVLTGYERDLLEFVFRGETDVSSDELDAWATANQPSAQASLKAITTGVTADFQQRKYESGAGGRPLMMLAGLCLFIAAGSLVLRVYSGNGIAWAGIVVAVALFAIGAKALGNRTQAGVEAAAKANGLRSYIEDFSQLADAPVGHLILWERYLVYAVALGVSGELISGLASRLPGLLNDPSFGAWYAGPYGHGRFDGFDRIETGGTSLAAASTPNSSGGGGGFSGGSSGGGGGGSAGAR